MVNNTGVKGDSGQEKEKPNTLALQFTTVATLLCVDGNIAKIRTTRHKKFTKPLYEGSNITEYLATLHYFITSKFCKSASPFPTRGAAALPLGTRCSPLPSAFPR